MKNNISTRDLNIALIGEQIEINVHSEQGGTVWIVFDEERNTFKVGDFIGEVVHPDTKPYIANDKLLLPSINDVGFTSKGLLVRVLG